MSSEHDLVVLGDGPAGLAAAERAAELGSEVALVRPRLLRRRGVVMGRVLRAAYEDASGPAVAGTYGGAPRVRADLRFDELRARVDRVAEQQAASADASLRARGVTVIDGMASFESPHVVVAADGIVMQRVHAGRVVVAVGAVPSRPADVAFDGRSIVAADDLLSLHDLPARVTIVGAGPIGLEYASLFATLGSRVALLEQEAEIDAFANRRTLGALLSHLADLHVEIRTSSRALGAHRDAYGTTFTHLEGQAPISSRAVIWAAGMRPATAGLNLVAAGVSIDGQGRIGVDSSYRTTNSDIFAAGAAVGGWMPQNESAFAGRAAASAALDHPLDDAGWPIARALHTIPEIASVGPTSAELEREGTPYVRGCATGDDVLSAQIVGDTQSVLELYVSPRDHTILAAHAFGRRAVETIHLAQMAIGSDITIDALARFPFIHPSFSEAYRVAARDAVARLSEVDEPSGGARPR